MAWILPFTQEQVDNGEATDDRNLYIAYNQLAIQIGKYVDFFNTWYNDVIDPSNNTNPSPSTNPATEETTIGKKLYPRYGIDSNPFEAPNAAHKYEQWKKSLPWDLYGDEEPRTVASGDVQLSLPLRRYLGPTGYTYITNPGVSSMVPLDDFYNKNAIKRWVLRPRSADGVNSSGSPYRALYLKINQKDSFKGTSDMKKVVWPDRISLHPTSRRAVLDVMWHDERISTQNAVNRLFDATARPKASGYEVSQGKAFKKPTFARVGGNLFGREGHQPDYVPTEELEIGTAGGQPYPYGWINPGWQNLQITLINLFGGYRGNEILQTQDSSPWWLSGLTIDEDGTLLAPLKYEKFSTPTASTTAAMKGLHSEFGPTAPNGDGAPFAGKLGFGEWNDGYYELRKRANVWLKKKDGVGEFFVGDSDRVARYHTTYKEEDAVNNGEGCAPFSNGHGSAERSYMGFLTGITPPFNDPDQSAGVLQGASLVNQMWAICMVFEFEAGYLNVGMGKPDPTEFCCDGGEPAQWCCVSGEPDPDQEPPNCCPVPADFCSYFDVNGNLVTRPDGCYPAEPVPPEGFCNEKEDWCYRDDNLPYISPGPPNVPLENTVEGSESQDGTWTDSPWSPSDADESICDELTPQICNILDLKNRYGFDIVNDNPFSPEVPTPGHTENSDDGSDATRDQSDNQLEDNPTTFGTIREGVTLSILKTCNPDPDPTLDQTPNYIPRVQTITQIQPYFQFFARFQGNSIYHGWSEGGGIDLCIFRHLAGGEEEDSSFFNPYGNTGAFMIPEVQLRKIGDIITVEEFPNNTADTITFIDSPHVVDYNGDTVDVGFDVCCKNGVPVAPDPEDETWRGGPPGFCVGRNDGCYKVKMSDVDMTTAKRCVDGEPWYPCDGIPNGSAEGVVPVVPWTYYYVLKGSENCLLNKSVIVDGKQVTLKCGTYTNTLGVIETLVTGGVECGDLVTLEIYFDPYVIGRKNVSFDEDGLITGSGYGEPPTNGRG